MSSRDEIKKTLRDSGLIIPSSGDPIDLDAAQGIRPCKLGCEEGCFLGWCAFNWCVTGCSADWCHLGCASICVSSACMDTSFIGGGGTGGVGGGGGGGAG